MFEQVIENWNRIATIAIGSLVNSAIITTAAVALAVFAARFKGWSAASRYALWWLVLIFVIVAPFASAVLPERQTLSMGHTPMIRLAVATFPEIGSTGRIVTTRIRPTGMSLFLLCWSAAILLQSLRLLRSFFFGFRLKRASRPAENDLQHSFARLCRQVTLRRGVRLSISQQLLSPAVLGYFRPHVLIPAALVARLSADELEQILLHELSHVARYDDWGIAAQRLIEAAGIFHPLVLFLSRRLSLDREMACDDRVAAWHEPKRYLACLAKVAEISHFPAASAILVPLFERPSELLARVEGLLDKTRTHLPKLSGRRLAAAMVGCVMLAFVGLRAPRLMALPVQDSSEPSSIMITPAGTIEFKTNGKLYVIRDKEIVARARQLAQPMQDLGGKQGLLVEEQGALGQEQALLSQAKLTPEMEQQMGRALRDLKGSLDKVNSELMQKQTSELPERLAEMQANLGEMQAKLGSEQSLFNEQLSRLGGLSDLIRQQAEFGKLQAELGRQQAAEAERVQKQLQELVREAISRGLAQQAK